VEQKTKPGLPFAGNVEKLVKVVDLINEPES
jgi:hypothetical protein